MSQGLPNNRDRRQFIRHRPQAVTRLRCANVTHHCKILDIGMGGLKVQTDGELTAGAEVILSDPLAGELTGEIVWTSGNTASIRLDHDEMVPTFVISNIVQQDLPSHVTRRPRKDIAGLLAWLTWPFRRAENL